MQVELTQVRWLGGGSGAGKTTVARLLAQRCRLRLYDTDAAIRRHGADPNSETPLLMDFVAGDMDERWLRRDAQKMLQTFPWFAGERFERIVEDLAALPAQMMTLAEGFRILPRLVAPLLQEPWQALWLLPTPEMRRRAFAQRPASMQFWRRTSDPNAALERLLERDALFTEQLAAEAAALNFPTIRVDGSAAADEVATAAAESLRLPV